MSEPQNQIEDVPIKKCKPSPFQRRTFKDKKKQADLNASVKEHGVLENLIGRRVNGHIELIAGHRRYEAAEAAGHKTVPVKVIDVDDRTAEELCLIENVQREDLDPMDEAEAFGSLLAAGNSPETAAKKVNKPLAFVHERLRLLKLSKKAREALRKNQLTVTGALALSRLEAHDEQDQVLKSVVYGDDPAEVSRVRMAVERMLRDLSKVPFDIKSADLVPAAGACTQCPKRTGNQFALPGIDAKVTKDQCTDAVCFSSKLGADWDLRVKDARAQGIQVLSKKDTEVIFADHGGVNHESKKEWCVLDLEYAEVGKTVQDTISTMETKPKPEEQHLARDANGWPHLVMQRPVVRKLLKALKKKPGDKTAAEIKDAEEQKAYKLKLRILQETQQRAFEKMFAEAGKPEPRNLLLALVIAIAEDMPVDGDTWKALGYRDRDNAISEILAKPSDVARQTQVALSFIRENMPGDRYGSAFQVLCDEGFDIDYGQLEVDVTREIAGSKKREKAQ